MNCRYNIFLFAIVATLGFLSCEEEKTYETTYRGKVINTASNREPFPNLEVSITDGANVNKITHTDASGEFSILVRFNEVNSNYVLLIGDSSCMPVKKELRGLGKSEIDLGIIEVEGPRIPEVETVDVIPDKAGTAVCKGRVTNDGRANIFARGVCWSKEQSPTINDCHTTDGGGLGEFESRIPDLDLGTAYYVRTYATNRIGTAYGKPMLISTADGLSTLEINDWSATATSINISGTVKDDGGFPVTERGICYSVSNMEPTILDKKVPCGDGMGSFSVSISPLSPETTYYLRAYAINQNGPSYSEYENVITQTGIPEVMLGDISPTIETASATVTVTKVNGAELQNCGICWSERHNPSIQNNKNEVTEEGKKLNTPYTCNMSNLTPNTTYYVRAFATTNITTEYSKEESFKTTSGAPTDVTTKMEQRGKDYIIISGSAKTTSSAPITRQGVCWSTKPYPSIDDNVVEASVKANPFSCRISGLEPGTTYYCKAFADNKYDITYGNQVSTTTDYEPAVLKGHVYDQDGFPVAGAKVKTNGSGVSSVETTDNNGYYEVSLSLSYSKSLSILVSADGYLESEKQILMNPSQNEVVDYNISLIKTCDIDLGNGLWADGPSYMIFTCQQQSLAGKTTTRNMRLRNYRHVPVTWSLSNLPSQGLRVSQSSGTIPANSEISVIVTFTYPSTNAQAVNLTGCSSGSKAYVWNWESVVGGITLSDTGNGDYSVHYDSCTACCEQGVYIHIGSEEGGFNILFNQYVTYR